MCSYTSYTRFPSWRHLEVLAISALPCKDPRHVTTVARSVQLSIFLQADTEPWAAQFCVALVAHHPDLARAWRLLQPESDHTVSVILRAHAVLCDDSPLLSKLQRLPPFLHEHAYRATYARAHPAPPLESAASLVARHVDVLGASAGPTMARMSAALAAAKGGISERIRAS